MQIKHIYEYVTLPEVTGVAMPAPFASGIACIDENANGGMRAGDVWLVAGRPHAWCGQFAMRMTLLMVKQHKLPTVYFSGHSSRAATANLFTQLTAMADLGKQEYFASELSPVELSKAACDLQALPLYFGDDWPLDLDAIDAAAWHAMGGFSEPFATSLRGIVVIDSMELLQATTSLSFSAVAAGLKKIASEGNLGIIMTAKIGRHVEENTIPIPRPIDIENYGNIVPWVDNFICLHRPEVYERTDGRKNTLEIYGNGKTSAKSLDLLRTPKINEDYRY